MKRLTSAASPPALCARGLVKRFGERSALSSVDLTVEPGELVGLLGSNGAGKTTLLRLAATLLAPSAGTLIVAGWALPRQADRARPGIGYMADRIGPEEHASVRDWLRFFALLYGVPHRERDRRVEEVLEEAGLRREGWTDVQVLSRGQQQRLGLARLLLRRARLLLLDEPLSGLDPRGRREFMEVLDRARAAGGAVLASCHAACDLEGWATHLAILEAGRVCFAGSVAAARHSVAERLGWVLVVAEGPTLLRGAAEAAGAEGARRALAAHPETAEVRLEVGGSGLRLVLRPRRPAAGVAWAVEWLVARGFRIREVAEEKPTLEGIFLRHTKGWVA